MWTITRINEADYGCEERLPGEPLLVQVTIEDEDGREACFEVADAWLISNNLNEGDEWPEDIEAMEASLESSDKMAAWMENYYSALDELEETMGGRTDGSDCPA